MSENDIFDSDVLIIGGGGAGASAGIWAAKKAARVSIVEKGIFGKSGCTPMGAFSICAAFGYGDPKDNPQIHMEDTIRQGQFINNQELVKIFSQEAPDKIRELISYGAHFDHDVKGELKQVLMPGHTYPRACFHDRKTGPMLMRTLAQKVKNTSNITVFEEIIIVKLVMGPKDCHYAIGICWANSKIIVFRTKAIVITSGGCGQIYKNTTTSIDNTGDGLNLMFQVGAELSDMEFIQFYPTTVCHPKFLGLGPTAPAQLRIQTGARLYNKLGEDFMEKKMPGWRFKSPRDVLSQAIYKEIIEGRGTPHGGVYMDVTHLSPQEIKEKLSIGNIYKILLNNGIDITKRPIETTVSAHFLMGGSRINRKGETNISGLYAGGEAAAGYHGANRLGGNALSEILVSGSKAGLSAAESISNNHWNDINEKELKQRLHSIEGMISKWINRKTGIRPIELKRRVKEIMWEKCGVIRTGPKIREGLDQILTIEKLAQKDLRICNMGRYNREILDAFELNSMVTVAKLILIAALKREETRGAHYREDFLLRDDEKWLSNIILSKDFQKVNTKTKAVSLTYLRPE